jgi:diaminopimelate decarboxylase
MPATAQVNSAGHLVIGGCDTVKLAEKFGTPLWVIDEVTIRNAIAACRSGVSDYPQAQIVYAGKAFLCAAICHLLKSESIGLDVVSHGELLTAISAAFPASSILLHGNNKSAIELEASLDYGPVRIVVDNYSELEMLAAIARKLGRRANMLLRVIPGVEPDTHSHIKTGHHESKFGIPLSEIDRYIAYIKRFSKELNFLGLHVHIGSQALDMAPYFQVVEILAECLTKIKSDHGLLLEQLDLGGGLGIAYTENEHPTPLYDWSNQLSERVKQIFNKAGLPLPVLILEPGRSLIGTAGVTLYRVGHTKILADGRLCVAVDGGMADNPRPITYQAVYTACLANRMQAPKPKEPATIVGKYCEQGDIIIKEAEIGAETGDIIAVFGTGAYNFSMASNYNRTARPGGVIVLDGEGEIIIERESNEELLKKDRVPDRLLATSAMPPRIKT